MACNVSGLAAAHEVFPPWLVVEYGAVGKAFPAFSFGLQREAVENDRRSYIESGQSRTNQKHAHRCTELERKLFAH